MISERIGARIGSDDLAESYGPNDADNRKHRLAAVHELGLAGVVEVATQLRDRGREAERIESLIARHRACEAHYTRAPERQLATTKRGPKKVATAARLLRSSFEAAHRRAPAAS